MGSVISLEERRKQLQRAKIIAELEAQANAACKSGRARPKYLSAEGFLIAVLALSISAAIVLAGKALSDTVNKKIAPDVETPSAEISHG
jgi:hypothetical protein